MKKSWLKWLAICFVAILISSYLESRTKAMAQAAKASSPGKTASSEKGKSDYKFGVIDMQAIILAVEEGKKARETLEKEIKAKEKELLKQKEELDKMNEQWKSQAPLLSEEARMKKQQEFQEKFLALKQEEMNFQAEIKRKEQQATQKIAVKVSSMVEKMAETKGLEAVFESSSAGLLYLKNPLNLTKEVIENYAKAEGPKVSKKEGKE